MSRICQPLSKQSAGKDYQKLLSTKEQNRAEVRQNGDANGAYNIARKGPCLLQQIDQSANFDKFIFTPVYKIDWQDYAQSEEIVARQKSKWS